MDLIGPWVRTNQWCLSASSIGRYDVGHFTDHYKIASWCVLGGIIQRGSISGRGGDSPLGNGDPVSICVKIQAHHHSNTGTSVSQPPSRRQFFRGFLGPIYDFIEDIESNGAAPC